MKDICAIAEITKQGYYKGINKASGQDYTNQVIQAVEKIRKDHKRMSCRKIYWKVKDHVQVGRDNFEKIAFRSGYKIRKKRSVQKTTNGKGKPAYPNLIEGKIINGINQAFQSDIFYYSVDGQDRYGFTIKDIYSRRLLALHFSKTLKAEELVKAIKQAGAERGTHVFENCIFHSDRGSQYISHKAREVIQNQYKMRSSMCVMPQENAYVERIQGTLKQEYLDENELTIQGLNRMAKRIKYLYNQERPHYSLNMMSPVEFEAYIESIPEHKRPKQEIYKWENGFQQLRDLLTKKKEAKKKV